jgi:hypothetical protein
MAQSIMAPGIMAPGIMALSLGRMGQDKRRDRQTGPDQIGQAKMAMAHDAVFMPAKPPAIHRYDASAGNAKRALGKTGHCKTASCKIVRTGNPLRHITPS